MRALAQLGVHHEPDFPVEVGLAGQLPTKDATAAVDQYGAALLLSLSRAGARMPPEDAHLFLHADGEGRAEIVRMLADRHVDAGTA